MAAGLAVVGLGVWLRQTRPQIGVVGSSADPMEVVKETALHAG